MSAFLCEIKWASQNKTAQQIPDSFVAIIPHIMLCRCAVTEWPIFIVVYKLHMLIHMLLSITREYIYIKPYAIYSCSDRSTCVLNYMQCVYMYLLVRLAIGSLEVMCLSMWVSRARWSPFITALPSSWYSKYFPVHVYEMVTTYNVHMQKGQLAITQPFQLIVV